MNGTSVRGTELVDGKQSDKIVGLDLRSLLYYLEGCMHTMFQFTQE